MPHELHLTAWTALDSTLASRTISGLPERGLTLKPVMIECQDDERDLIGVFLGRCIPLPDGNRSRPAAPAPARAGLEPHPAPSVGHAVGRDHDIT
jgi:hypothetical protein